MLRIIKERLHQKYRTLDYPNRQPALSARYLGRPELAQVSCGSCRACFAACPAGALLPTAGAEDGTPTLDMPGKPTSRKMRSQWPRASSARAASASGAVAVS